MTEHSTAGAGAATAHTFQAEVSRLLELMIHSVYTDREVFLRELISNASDACDKLRYEAIAKPELLGGARLAITLRADKDKGTLTIADNGIGMSRDELVDNLGTIARSGTRAFLERIGGPGESSALIGQFGVGFYSAFMVARAIEVVSRKAGATEAWTWVSEGAGGFRIEAAPAGPSLADGHGTVVTLTLKDDAKTYLDEGELERIVRTYSDHILFPVQLAGPDGKARQLNSASALWQRSKAEVKPEEYKEVYQTIAGQYDEPAHVLHWRAEGRQSYAVLLFIPERRPFDLFDPSRKGRVRLYVRRVFITEDADLLPAYLRFVRGVVDSEDVPLNISREMLQNNPQVGQIRRALTTRVIAELTTLADKEADRFAKVWETFGSVLKEGIYEDFERREEILKLARFRSTAGPGWRSLKDYVGAMRPSQTEIYFLAGDSLERLKASPQIEAARARGVEVLLLPDPVDSFWTSMPLGFEGKSLKSLSKGEVDLGSIPTLEPQADAAPESREAGALIAAFKTSLGERVSEVRISKRLVESPACLVAAGEGPDRGLEKILARQERGAGLKPILEINPRHALLRAAIAEQARRRPDAVHDIALILFDQALLLEGELPADPAAFAERVNRLVVRGLGTGATEA